MRFNLQLLLSLILGTTLVSTNPLFDKPYVGCICEEGTYINTTSDNSPKISDCRQLVENLSKKGAQSLYPFSGAKMDVGSYQTCHFMVQATGAIGSALGVNINREDVVRFIITSVAKFGVYHFVDSELVMDGVVGAEGNTKCSFGSRVWWAIY